MHRPLPKTALLFFPPTALHRQTAHQAAVAEDMPTQVPADPAKDMRAAKGAERLPGRSAILPIFRICLVLAAAAEGCMITTTMEAIPATQTPKALQAAPVAPMGAMVLPAPRWPGAAKANGPMAQGGLTAEAKAAAPLHIMVPAAVEIQVPAIRV